MRISDWSSDVCSSDLPLIVEVETLAQLEEALAECCERILIDDLDAETRREAVRIAAGEPFNRAIPLEVSGGVDLPGLRAIAEDGVDCISIGALTKHVRAIDLSMKLRSEEHTSELQSLMRTSYAVFCLKTKINNRLTEA